MTHKVALFVPLAIVLATACGSESPSATEDDVQSIDQGEATSESTGALETTSNEPVASSESELRGGRGGFVARGPRGGVVAGRRGYVAGGGRYLGRGYVAGYRRGWVHGRWAPGWGWSHGHWIAGGGAQYSCAVDADCAGPLGAGVAVCSYDPNAALGYCVAPNW